MVELPISVTVPKYPRPLPLQLAFINTSIWAGAMALSLQLPVPLAVCRFGFEFMFHATPAAPVPATIAALPYACACLWFYGIASVSAMWAILYSCPANLPPCRPATRPSFHTLLPLLPSLIRFKLCTTSTLLTPAVAGVCECVAVSVFMSVSSMRLPYDIVHTPCWPAKCPTPQYSGHVL